MTISQEVDAARRDIRTDDYPMSIGEWISLYQQEDLDIHPEFQRFYRWTDQQKSALIESILLGIPLPPIFVSQRQDGVWDVIDGLQRLSTIFQFVGILKDLNDTPVQPLRLLKTTYLPSLENMEWESADETLTIPEELKRAFKRSKIHVSIILKESDQKTKYELFQRLNTGGSQLSPQEVRNCILVMSNAEFYQWLKQLSTYEPFHLTMALSDKPLAEAYDIEQVLRFLTLAEATDQQVQAVGDLGAYLTTQMIQLAEDPTFDKADWQERLHNTFYQLSLTVGDNAFKRFNVAKNRHEGGFLVSQFETVTCGVSWSLARGTLRSDLDCAIQELWSDAAYTRWIGSGINAASRLRRTIPFARRHFAQQ